MARWTVVVAALCALALSLPALAQWKWRNHAGQTQYSDLPPPSGIADKDILSRPGAAKHAPTAALAAASGASPSAAASGTVASSGAPAASAATALKPKTAEPELDAKRRQAEQEQAAKAKADEARVAAARAENCNRAKGQMRTLDSGMRIARANAKGEREILDDTARAEEAKRARAVIDTNCS